MYPAQYPVHLVRVSDAERETIVAQLSVATAEGRLTLDEFSDRTQRAYAARTWGELVSLVGDLPRSAVAASGHGKAVSVLAMILGSVSVVAIAFAPLGALVGAAALVLGIMGFRAADRGEPTHRGFALAGVVCGSFGVLLTLAWIALLVVLN